MIYIKGPKSKRLRHFLTNHLFKFLFENYYDDVKNGDILCINDDLFEFDDYNGNINSLKTFYPWINGFWNEIEPKNGVVYNITDDKWLTTNSQGFVGSYYKNGFEKATEEEIKLYKDKLKSKK